MATAVLALTALLLPISASASVGNAENSDDALEADSLDAEEPEPAISAEVVAGAEALIPQRVREVEASSRNLTQLRAELEHLEETIVTNRMIHEAAVVKLAQLQNQRDTLRADLSAARNSQLEASFRMERHRGELRSLAIQAYMGGGRSSESLIYGAAGANVAGSEAVIVGQVESTLRRNLGLAQADFASATTDVNRYEADLLTTLEEISDTEHQRAAAEAELARVEPTVPRIQEQYRDAYLVANVVGANFSVVALDAYLGAVETVPHCRISWTVLAGIGRVESFHGTFGRSQPRPNGVVSPRIIGIALDGSEGVALINDTDGGRYDGDATYDRAVGPMQFIPSTWRAWSRDGNGDGIRDPHNLYDATAAAAAYLCKNSSRLDNAGVLRSAILSYNQSDAYVNAVLGYHNSYRRLNIG